MVEKIKEDKREADKVESEKQEIALAKMEHEVRME